MIANHKDVERTKLLRRAGIFRSRKSYVSIAGHYYLRGEDRSLQRERLVREQGLRCAICKQPVAAWDADMDHIRGGNKYARCDCLGVTLAGGSRCTNLQIVHGMRSKRGCHARKHHRIASQSSAG